MLVFHGILDNAGSFDLLIPLLSPQFYYICIDLPGHGKSSHFPGFTPIHLEDYVPVYKLIMDYFNRGKYIVMAHSFGGQISVKFAQVYPEYITKMVLLDIVHPLCVSPRRYKEYLENIFDNTLKYIDIIKKNSDPPTYTYEEAANRLIQNRFYEELTMQAAEALLKRNLTPVGNGMFKFSHDPRLKFFMQPVADDRYAIDVLKLHPIKCPVLVVLARGNLYQRKVMHLIIKYYEKQPNIKIKKVEKNHNVHITHPEIVAPHVNDFLVGKQKSKL